MADIRESELGVHPGRLAAMAMQVGAGLVALAGVVLVVVGFYVLPQCDLTGAGRVLTGVGLVGGLALLWGLALLLWGGAALVRGACASEAPRVADPGMALPGVPARASTEQVEALERLAQLIRELRDIALLTDHEKNMRARVEATALVKQLEAEVPALLREHSWQEARARVQRARLRFPSLDELGRA